MGDSTFRSLLLEGLFYEKDGRLVVNRDGRDVDLLLELHPFIGRSVQLAIFHAPPSPVVDGAWGLGCCHWEGAGTCPAGHDKAPGRLVLVKGGGLLENGPLRLTSPNGAVLSMDSVLPLLSGHESRVMIVTTDYKPISVNEGNFSQVIQDLGEMRRIVQDILHLTGV